MIKTIVVVDRNENNKIELTKEELTNLLNEIYLNGYEEGAQNSSKNLYSDSDNNIIMKNIKNGKGLKRL